MADGEITVKLDDQTQTRLAEAASAAGVSIEDYVRDIIADELGRDPLAVSRSRLAAYDRTGEYISVEEAMTHFESAQGVRLAGRG